ncbi:hypothetical protein QQS21_006397 [Conoideocrella luteorostrata]|uniref:Uncharacterized protein n=1 Tax=Conoideocrella luteorostrata TaxID=1105319 RepID=A0AAJ0CQG1_9HYPO|nr:hypothetical protein QQS21_006397 [Conoideocrella luteorostrata]
MTPMPQPWHGPAASSGQVPWSTTPDRLSLPPPGNHSPAGRVHSHGQQSGGNSVKNQQGFRQQSHEQQPHEQVQAGNPENSTFPSPRPGTSELFRSTPYQALMHLIKSTDPSTVRQVVRDSHRISLVGSEYHFAFLLNATFHNASLATLGTSIQDFGERLARSAKDSFLSHLTADDLDDCTDILLSKVSNKFLDRALARRLETIRARPLVNALAKAERLGYDGKDIVEEMRNGVEHVIPNSRPALAQQPVQPGAVQMSAQGTQKEQRQQQRLVGKSPYFMRCDTCGRPCSGAHALRYHKLKNACQNRGDVAQINRECAHCGTQFTNNSGFTYHTKSQVCGNYSSQHVQVIMPELERFYAKSIPTRAPATSHNTTQQSQAPIGPSGFKAANAGAATGSGSSPSVVPSKLANAYSHLSAKDRANFEAAMKQGEEKYGAEMRAVKEGNLTRSEQESELLKIKNRFCTRQSITRKKYGVKLRERRSKAELDAEVKRIVTDSAPTSSQNGPAAKKSRNNTGGESTITSWSSDLERAVDLPRRVPVGEMGGLGNPAATAEHTDPTVRSATTQSYQSSLPQSLPAAATQPNLTKAVHAPGQSGTPVNPLPFSDPSLDETDSNSEGGETGDIPARVPSPKQAGRVFQ